MICKYVCVNFEVFFGNLSKTTYNSELSSITVHSLSLIPKLLTKIYLTLVDWEETEAGTTPPGSLGAAWVPLRVVPHTLPVIHYTVGSTLVETVGVVERTAWCTSKREKVNTGLTDVGD